jgi:hypothetical protein
MPASACTVPHTEPSAALPCPDEKQARPCTTTWVSGRAKPGHARQRRRLLAWAGNTGRARSTAPSAHDVREVRAPVVGTGSFDRANRAGHPGPAAFLLKDRLHGHVAPLVDGRRTEWEIIQALEGRVSPPEAYLRTRRSSFRTSRGGLQIVELTDSTVTFTGCNHWRLSLARVSGQNEEARTSAIRSARRSAPDCPREPSAGCLRAARARAGARDARCRRRDPGAGSRCQRGGCPRRCAR